MVMRVLMDVMGWMWVWYGSVSGICCRVCVMGICCRVYFMGILNFMIS